MHVYMYVCACMRACVRACGFNRYQEVVKSPGLLTAVSGVFLQGGQHGTIGAAAAHEDDTEDGDRHVTFQRVVVLEERNGQELHVAASSKFAVSRRNMPCKQRMVLETPLKVKPGQLLGIASMDGNSQNQRTSRPHSICLSRSVRVNPNQLERGVGGRERK